MKGLSALREGAQEGEAGHLVSTAQGAVRLESDFSLRIIRMPEGRDPDEVIRADPELWGQLVAAAVPVMEFYIGAYTAGIDLADPQGQRAALEKLLPLLAELDGAQQRVYMARMEQVIGIKAELILDLLRGGPGGRRPEAWGRRPAAGPRAPRPAPPAPDPAPQRPATNGVEDYLLALALRHSTVVPAAVEALLELGLEPHPAVREMLGGGLEDLLENPANQQIWAAFLALPIEGRPADEAALEAWANWLEEPLRERFLALLAGAQRNPQDFRHRREAEDCARGLRLEQARRLHRMLLQRIAEPAEADGEPDRSAELRQLTALTQFIADTTAPRRSSTFPDLRDSLGKA